MNAAEGIAKLFIWIMLTLVSAFFIRQRVFNENDIFFSIQCNYCNPCLAFISLQEIIKVLKEISVKPLFYDQQQPSAGEGEVAKYWKFLREKKNIFANTLYVVGEGVTSGPRADGPIRRYAYSMLQVSDDLTFWGQRY